MNQENNTNEKDAALRNFFLLLILIFLIWAGSGWWINHFYGGGVTKRGTFGDMFGAINALFTGAALAGVIITIVLQQKELALQRTEIALNRKELSRAAHAQQQSAKLAAYTALLNAHTQEAYHIQDVLEKRYPDGNEELVQKFSYEIKMRNHYAVKVAALVDE